MLIRRLHIHDLTEIKLPLTIVIFLWSGFYLEVPFTVPVIESFCQNLTLMNVKMFRKMYFPENSKK